MKKRNSLLNMVLSAMFIAIGIVLPFITGNVTETGKMLCPMHLPIFICGAVCGWQWGLAAGILTPLIRSLLFSAPVMYPTAVCMALELATYGLVVGLMLKWLTGRIDRLGAVYISITTAMLIGRLVLGISHFTMYGMFGTPYSWDIFIASAFVQSLPAIVIQFAILPPVIFAFGKYGGKRR